MMHLLFAPIASSFDLTRFDCGVEELNVFLRSLSLLYQNRRFGITMVSFVEHDPTQRIVAYYTIAPAQVFRSELPNKLLSGPRPNPIPAFRLCRLAVDKADQGQGLGEIALFDALKKCYAAAEVFGGALILVDAKDDKAKDFYLQYGFQPLSTNPLCLVMNIKNIKKYI